MLNLMATYTTRVKLTEDRRITVEVPEDMPLGEAEVTVCVGDEEGPERGMTGKQLLAWLERDRMLHPRTWTPRTKEEIDAEIREGREDR